MNEIKKPAIRGDCEMPNAVGFTGTQAGMTHAQKWAVEGLLKRWNPDEVHHGLCIGADEEFHYICLGRKVPIIGHPPADTKKLMKFNNFDFAKLHDPAPYPVRNKAIVISTNRMIATPRQRYGEAQRSGTWSTVRFARRQWRPLALVRPDGMIEIERWDPVKS